MQRPTLDKIIFLVAALLSFPILSSTATAQTSSVSVAELSPKLNNLILDLGLENEVQQIEKIVLNEQPVILKKAGGTRTFVQISINPLQFTNMRTRTAAMLTAIIRIMAQMEFDAIQARLIDPRSDYFNYGELSFAEDELGCCGLYGPKYENGFWEGSVTPYVPSDKDIEIFQLWQKHRKRFQNVDGLTNEDKLMQFIASSSSHTVSDIEEAWYRNAKGTARLKEITPELFQ